MGKTKTAFVGGTEEQEKKPSYDKAAKEAKRKAAETKITIGQEVAKEAPKKIKTHIEKEEKIHIAGLKGGQRIKIIAAEETPIIPPSEVETDEKVAAKKERKQKVRGKNYINAKGKIDKNKLYQIPEAIKLIKETSFSKFDGTMEAHLIVKRQNINLNTQLPHSFGKAKKIEIASEETIEKLSKNKIDFDVLLATADMMPKLIPFAKILGPKGLMPNPKNKTLIKPEKDADLSAQAGNFSSTLNLKTEKDQPVIHTVFGKVSQKEDELEKNLRTILTAISEKEIAKVYIKSTMSPSVKILLH